MLYARSALFVSGLVASAEAFTLAPVQHAPRTRDVAISMVSPKGPFGGSGGPDDGWIGDRGKSVQVGKFEDGDDYLFFQGPAPKTAVQEDLPSFLSPENFADLEIKPLQVVFTLTGFASAAALGGLLLTSN